MTDLQSRMLASLERTRKWLAAKSITSGINSVEKQILEEDEAAMREAQQQPAERKSIPEVAAELADWSSAVTHQTYEGPACTLCGAVMVPEGFKCNSCKQAAPRKGGQNA